MADDKLAAEQAAIRERARRVWDGRGNVGGLLAITEAKDDVSRLLAALDEALKLTDDWERKAEERRAYAAEKLAAGNSIPAWIAEAGATGREQCAQTLRDAITRELTGEAL